MHRRERCPSRRFSSAVATCAIAVLLATVLVLGGTARRASACSCATTRGDDVASFDRANAVFSGVLTEVRTPTGDRPRPGSSPIGGAPSASHARQITLIIAAIATAGVGAFVLVRSRT